MKYALNDELIRKFQGHKKRGLSQGELAVRILRVHVATVGHWLRKEHTIKSINNVAVVRQYIAGEHDATVDALLAEKGGAV